MVGDEVPIAADGTYYLELGAEFLFPDGLTTVGYSLTREP